MRVGILTCSESGTASLCLPTLVSHQGFNVVGVVVATPAITNRRNHILRKVKKICRIGPLGALNGLRLRKWYEHPTPAISDIAHQYNVPVVRVEGTNSHACRASLSDLKLDLAISLGNPYISASTFNIPSNGMLNLHGELLPEYPGAQSVIWAIYEQSRVTGFSIHQVSKTIDGGTVLARSEHPILFCPTLFGTVQKTMENVRTHIPSILAQAIERYPQGTTSITERKPRRPTYTTPSYFEYMSMNRHNKLMYQSQSDGTKRT